MMQPVLSPSRKAVTVDFTAFVQPHLAAMRSYARRLVNESDYEDVIQDVLLKLYQLSHRLDEVREVRPWLMRAVYHRAIDLHRRRAREREVEVGGLMSESEEGEPAQEWACEAPGPEELMHREQTGDLVSAALEQLPESQRELLQLHDLLGHSLAEIATHRRMSVNTLKSTLSRGRRGLREQLQVASHGGLAPRGMPAGAGRSRRRRGRPVCGLPPQQPDESSGEA